MASRFVLCIELCAGGISGEAWEKRASAFGSTAGGPQQPDLRAWDFKHKTKGTAVTDRIPNCNFFGSCTLLLSQAQQARPAPARCGILEGEVRARDRCRSRATDNPVCVLMK